jgi:hypothetical protein
MMKEELHDNALPTKIGGLSRAEDATESGQTMLSDMRVLAREKCSQSGSISHDFRIRHFNCDTQRLEGFC